MPDDFWIVQGAFKDAAQNGRIPFAEGFCFSKSLRREPERNGLLATILSIGCSDLLELSDLGRSKLRAIFVRACRPELQAFRSGLLSTAYSNQCPYE